MRSAVRGNGCCAFWVTRSTTRSRPFNRGLEVIGGRSAALARFMASYTLLARMPAPTRAPVDVAAWIGRIVQMETRVPISVQTGPQIVIDADADQLDQ